MTRWSIEPDERDSSVKYKPSVRRNGVVMVDSNSPPYLVIRTPLAVQREQLPRRLENILIEEGGCSQLTEYAHPFLRSRTRVLGIRDERSAFEQFGEAMDNHGYEVRIDRGFAPFKVPSYRTVGQVFITQSTPPLVRDGGVEVD